MQLFVFALLFLCLCSAGQASSPQLQQIDAELKELEDTRTRYLSTARRLEDKGMSWQSQDETQEAKRAFHKADEFREAAKMLEPRIDELKAKRAQLLQEHPE